MQSTNPRKLTALRLLRTLSAVDHGQKTKDHTSVNFSVCVSMELIPSSKATNLSRQSFHGLRIFTLSGVHQRLPIFLDSPSMVYGYLFYEAFYSTFKVNSQHFLWHSLSTVDCHISLNRLIELSIISNTFFNMLSCLLSQNFP